MTVSYWAKQYIIKKLKAIEYKGGKCAKCNLKYHYSVYDFHHLDPSIKEMTWNQMKNKSWSKIIAELDKCIILCANCHRIIHTDLKNLKDVLEWRNKADLRRLKERQCKNKKCGKTYQPTFGRQQFCCYKCSCSRLEKINWPSNLPELVKNSSVANLANILGISGKAIYKRLRNRYNIPHGCNTDSNSVGTTIHRTVAQPV